MTKEINRPPQAIKCDLISNDLLEPKVSRDPGELELQPNTFHILDDVQRTYADVKGLRCCSTKPIEEGTVQLEYTSERARYSGTHKCKSKACVLCSHYVNEKNRQHVKEAVDRAMSADNIQVLFSTLTIPRMNCIKEQYDLLQSIWKGFIRQLKREYPVTYVKQVDITFGLGDKASYHQHLHTLLFIRGNDTSSMFLAEIERNIRELWRRIAKAKGVKVSDEAQDIQRVDETTSTDTLAEYVVKITKSCHEPEKITYEITSSQNKRAVDSGSMTLTELMRAIYETRGSNLHLVKMYKAFTNHSHRKPFFTKARDLFSFLPEKAREEEDSIEEEAVQDYWEDSKTLDLHPALFKMLTAYKLRGQTVDVMIGSMNGDKGLSYTTLCDLARQSLSKPYEPHIKVLTRISSAFIIYLGALLSDKKIKPHKYKRIMNKIRSSR